MGRWLARRLIITLVSFIGFTMIIFTLMRLSPVSPVDLMLFNMHQNGGLSTADIVRAAEAKLGAISEQIRDLSLLQCRLRRLVHVCEHGNSDDCVALHLGEPA